MAERVESDKEQQLDGQGQGQENEQPITGSDIDLDEIRRRSMEKLESMEKAISESEKIRADIAHRVRQNAAESAERSRGGHRATVILVLALVGICALSLLSLFVLKPMSGYNKAVKLMEEGRYDAAEEAFRALEDYKDSREMIRECYYRKGRELIASGKNGLALVQLNLAGDYKDSREIINGYIGSGDGLAAAGGSHSAAVNSIGRVLACGSNDYGQCNVEDWNGITAVAAGNNHTIALCADGSVVACGSNEQGQCDVASWHNIAYIAAFGDVSYGVREDGSVVSAGDNSRGQGDVENEVFTNVKKIVCGSEYAAALKEDGTVVMAGNTDKVRDALNWRDIKDISALNYTLCGLKEDGTVVFCGDVNSGGASDWTGIAHVASGSSYVVAVGSDGSLYSTVELTEGVEKVLSGALRIFCGREHILVLKSNGTVAAIGKNRYGECSVSDWRDVMIE